MPGLGREDIESIPVTLPPLPEQRRIAAALAEQMAAADRARAAAEAQLRAADALPAAYLRQFFDSPAARRWPRKRLGEACRLLPSKSISTDGDTEVRAITTACLTENGFAPAGIKTARMSAADAAQCAVQGGEVLVARSNTPDLVGRVALFSGEPAGVVASDLTIRVWSSEALRPAFLAAHLSFLYLSGYWKERAGGASGTMKKITREQLLGEPIPSPPVEEQHTTVNALRGKMDSSRHVRDAAAAQLAALARLPAALLRRAFAGGL